ncbi:MAG TPA: hypothetical protein VFI42_18470 [Thermomicrobiaceae bacterium]|nr:hypothetical protein [Thermomicrobiaceae bacterium]
MAVINKIMRLVGSGTDNGFESYYTALARRQGGPNASEARRDYERIRHILDKAFIIG